MHTEGRAFNCYQLFPRLEADIFRTYRELRSSAPVCWADDMGCWMVTRYEHVNRLIAERRLGSVVPQYASMTCDEADVERFFARWLVFADDADYHTEMKRRVAPLLSKRSIDTLDAGMRDEALQCIDQIEDGNIEAVSRIINPLTEAVARMVLGINRADAPRVIAIARHLLAYLSAESRDPALVNDRISDLVDYVKVSSKLATSSAQSSRLWSALSGIKSNFDRAAVFAQLLTGIVGPLAASLTSAVYGASRYWSTMEVAEARAAIIEESLRFSTPFHFAPRTALFDMSIGDALVREGEHVKLVLISANHDESVFPEPEQFSLANVRVPHLSFGGGLHACLGAYLSRHFLNQTLSLLPQQFSCLKVHHSPSRRSSYGATVFDSLQIALRR